MQLYQLIEKGITGNLDKRISYRILTENIWSSPKWIIFVSGNQNIRWPPVSLKVEVMGDDGHIERIPWFYEVGIHEDGSHLSSMIKDLLNKVFKKEELNGP